MKLEDVDPVLVVRLAWKWRYSDTPLSPQEPGVVEALVLRGVPEKLAVRKVEQLESPAYCRSKFGAEGALLDSGVSSRYAWPTSAGERFLADQR